MDAIDEKLVLALRENGRASTAQLARLVGRSRTSVQSRIERLEKQGVIVGYTALLAPEHGLGAVRAHVMIKVGPKEARAVTAGLRVIPQVRVLHSVSGEVDFIAVAATASVAEMDQVIDRIGALDGVERTTSSIILSTKFDLYMFCIRHPRFARICGCGARGKCGDVRRSATGPRRALVHVNTRQQTADHVELYRRLVQYM